MNGKISPDDWYPLATTQELGNCRVLARKLYGLPIVLFRDKEGLAAALVDRCPHRFAPLSQGRVIDGQIQCPYHGWQFDHNGHCIHVPGLKNECSTQSVVQTLHCHEASGLISVSEGSKKFSTLKPLYNESDVDSFFISDRVNATIAEAAENFLDGFHTHFVHKGWVRSDKDRQNFTATVHHYSDSIEVIYSGETLQNGFISRWLEGKRGISMGRFRLPGFAEIEYRDASNNLNLLASMWMVPEDDEFLQVYVRIKTAKKLIPAFIKEFFLRSLFGVILKQDKKILEAVRKNIIAFEKYDASVDFTSPKNQLNCANDILGPVIQELLKKRYLEEKTEIIIVNL